MEKYFPEKFEKKLHEESYPPNPLAKFKELKTPSPLEKTDGKMPLLSSFIADHEGKLLSDLEAAQEEQLPSKDMTDPERKLLGSLIENYKNKLLDSLAEARKITQKIRLLRSLEADRERQFFMLWTVWMYDKGLEGQDAYQRALEDSVQVVLILASMEIPLEVLVIGLIALQKELPVGTDLDSLPTLLLMFLSLNRDWYSGLENSEKPQLRAFLERCLILELRGLGLQAEAFPAAEHEQLGEAFKSEAEFKCSLLNPDTIAKFARYFYKVTHAGCPAFLLKRMFDFCLENSSFKKEVRECAMLDGKHCFIAALILAREMVAKDVGLKSMGNVECLHDGILYDEIGRTIERCGREISSLSNWYSKKNLEAKEEEWTKEEWRKASSARKCWTASKKGTKGGLF